VNDLLPLLLSTGGAAFITAIVMGVKTLRDGRTASEDSIVKRLNEDAKQAHSDADAQRDRANRLEQEREQMRLERNAANERADGYRRALIRNGIDPDHIPG
jgi:hypothetical protein